LETLRKEADLGARIAAVLLEVSGSNDGTPQIVRRFRDSWPKIVVLEEATRQGLAHAVSQMIRDAPTDIIVRIDADVKFRPGVIRRLLEKVRDPQIGIVGPRIVPAPSGNPILDRMLHAEYELHHLISVESPKITNVQVFRRFGGEMHDDVETEDILLQDLATEGGGQAVYAPEETVLIIPPTSILNFLRQRVRIITSERWYLHRTGRKPAPTTQFAFFARATLAGIRSGTLQPTDLVLFLITETSGRFYSRARYTLVGHVSLSTWRSVRGGDRETPGG
jgi:hypothetical protein